MTCELGIIEGAQLSGDELTVTGHAWYGLAFDCDDPYLVTTFEGIGSFLEKDLDELRGAGDVYRCEILQELEGLFVKFILWEETEVEFSCKEVKTHSRYYNENELASIFQWLPERSTPEELEKYVSDISRRGFCITNSNGRFAFAKASDGEATDTPIVS